MSLRTAQVALLLGATVTMGLMAGVFGLYAHTIMRGLGNTDDRTFIGAFQSMDRAIINPVFMLAFLGALACTGVGTLLYVRGDDRTVLPWIAVAFGLYLAVIVITMAVNVPLNDGLKAAGDPNAIADADVAKVRDDFHESRWIAWNIVRAVSSTIAFGCLAWALVLHGRITPTSTDRGERPVASVASVGSSAEAWPAPTGARREEPSML